MYKTVVDSKVREKELLSLRNSLVGKMRTDFADPIEEYYYKKKIAKLVLQQLEYEKIK